MWYSGQSVLLCNNNQSIDIVNVHRVRKKYFSVTNRHGVESSIRFRTDNGRQCSNNNNKPLYVRPASHLKLQEFLKEVERIDLHMILMAIRRDEIINLTKEQAKELEIFLKELGLYNPMNKGLTY